MPAYGDVFRPYKLFNGIFIPEALAKYRELSPGAKLIYGRLCRYAGDSGDAYPAVENLAAEIGLRTTQARHYLRELGEKNFLCSEVRLNEKGRQTSNRYKFLWHPAFDGEIGEPRKAPPTASEGSLRASDNRTPRGSDNRTPGASDNRTPGGFGYPDPKRVIEEESHHHHQESQLKRVSARAKNRASAAASSRPRPDRKTPEPEHPEAPLSEIDDDDEKPRTRKALDDPRAEFSARLKERHGSLIRDGRLNPDDVLKNVTNALEEGLRFDAGFLQFDATRTTNPKKLRNPAGYYLKLARAYMEVWLAEQRNSAAQRAIDRLEAALVPEAPGYQCDKCKGRTPGQGIALDLKTQKLVFCECTTDLEYVTRQIDRRPADFERSYIDRLEREGKYRPGTAGTSAA